MSRKLTTAVSLYRPDVIVWDAGMRMPERAPDFRAASIPAIALLPDVGDVSIAWNAGARGLLPREASAENLAAAIGAVAQGFVVIDPMFRVRAFSDARIVAATGRRTDAARIASVAPDGGRAIEQVDCARARHQRKHTVKFHVNAILGKLNVQSRTEAVVHATRLGLILPLIPSHTRVV